MKKTIPADLIKLSNVKDKNFVKKAMYDKLVTKVNVIDTKSPITIGLVTKTQYDLHKKGLRKRLKMLTKIYSILMGWSRIMMTIQKLERLETRYLIAQVLLLLLILIN